MTDGESSSTMPAARSDAGAEKSEAQLLFDQMRATLLRFTAIRTRLGKVREAIATSKLSHVGADSAAGSPINTTVFFEGIRGIAAANDRIADDLEQAVEDLAKLF